MRLSSRQILAGIGWVAAFVWWALRGLVKWSVAHARARLAVKPRRRPAGLWLGLGSVSIAAVLGALLFLGFARIGGYDAEVTDRLRQAIKTPPTLADLESELDCLARNVYFEARGEPDQGKAAVAHVVMNRAASGSFPNTACAVVRQGGAKVRHKCQFSWWCDGRSDQPSDGPAWATSQEIAEKVYWGDSDDPTAGALWYHAVAVKPVWRKALVRGPQIGDHIFYVAPADQTQLASRPESAPE